VWDIANSNEGDEGDEGRFRESREEKIFSGNSGGERVATCGVHVMSM
jgi:hypothetical protein